MDFPYCQIHDWSGRWVGGDYCRMCRYDGKPIYHGDGTYLGIVKAVVEVPVNDEYEPMLKTEMGTFTDNNILRANLFDRVWYLDNDGEVSIGTIEGFFSDGDFNIQNFDTGQKHPVHPNRTRLSIA